MTTAPPRTAARPRSLDPVVPLATASLRARRQALDTLREIDALLALGESASSAVERKVHVRNTQRHVVPSGTPGPGTYDPHKEYFQWRHHTGVTLHHSTPAKTKKTAIVRCEHARAVKTPGPGAYDVAAADRVVKPRVLSATIRSKETRRHTDVGSSPPSEPLEPARADKWLTRYAPLKGAVAYRPSSSMANTSLSRDQREKLRRIHLQKTRHTRVGFYDVQFALTERRIGTLGVVPMAKSATRCGSESKRHVQATAKRLLRAWNSAGSKSRSLQQQKTTAPDDERKAKHVPVTMTIQSQRARARALLHQRDAKLRADSDQIKSMRLDRRRDLVAHDMTKHSGRDTVRCPRKHLRITTHFTTPPRKQLDRQSSSVSQQTIPKTSTTVAYHKMLGRDEFTVDADGVYLVGRERELETAKARVMGDPQDHAIRARVPAAIIREAHTPTRPHGTEPTLVLSPKFTLVEKRPRGHAFLTFDNQLDRRERAKPKAFALENEPLDRYDVSDAAVTALDTLKFPRRDRGSIDFNHMIGRVGPVGRPMETSTMDAHTGNDTRDYQSKHPRVVCLVDMDKASARCG